jgi:hypothetical protein
MKTLPPSEAVFVVGEGIVTALAGGPLSLADMGPRRTRRASHVEFSDSLNEWVVTDAATGIQLFQHPDYDTALRWETSEFNRRLSLAD